MDPGTHMVCARFYPLESGVTEVGIRVMVEAQTEPVARETAELLANVIKNHGS